MFLHDKRLNKSGWHNYIMYMIIIGYMINVHINNLYIIIMVYPKIEFQNKPLRTKGRNR